MPFRSSPLLLAAIYCCSLAAEVTVGEGVDGHPFRRYSTVDALDRRVHFFLSDAAEQGTASPLVVYIQGTGCSSHFVGAEERILAGVPSLLHRTLAGGARVMAVEKPGVEYLDDQGERPMQEGCRPQFAHEHTLERWAEAIAAAIRAARELPQIDESRAMVIGISEGGVVAVRVSNIEPSVTHAASLSAGGPNHLFVLAEFIRERGLDPTQEVFECWDQVQADPSSATRFCLDHSFRHWSSFFSTSLIEESLESTAHLYFVHGSEDRQNSIHGFDVLRAELAAKGRAAVFERLEGAGHSLNLPGQVPPEGLLAIFGRLATWFNPPR